jgi:hypothetical protein
LNFVGFFFQIFWSPNSEKRLVFNSNGQIRIQTVKFEFKRTNQEAPPHYRPSASTAGGTARLSSNAGATVLSGQAVALSPAHRATSAPPLEPALVHGIMGFTYMEVVLVSGFCI